MYEYKAELVKVVDGDTIVVDIDLGLGVWLRKIRLRLLYINAPEMNTPEGKDCKTYLESVVEKNLLVKTHSRDKYGRWLADIRAVNRVETYSTLMTAYMFNNRDPD